MSSDRDPRQTYIQPLVAIHALAVSRSQIEGRECSTCAGSLRWLVVGFETRGFPTTIERLPYCSACDDVAEASESWPGTSSS